MVPSDGNNNNAGNRTDCFIRDNHYRKQNEYLERINFLSGSKTCEQQYNDNHSQTSYQPIISYEAVKQHHHTESYQPIKSYKPIESNQLLERRYPTESYEPITRNKSIEPTEIYQLTENYQPVDRYQTTESYQPITSYKTNKQEENFPPQFGYPKETNNEKQYSSVEDSIEKIEEARIPRVECFNGKPTSRTSSIHQASTVRYQRESKTSVGMSVIPGTDKLKTKGHDQYCNDFTKTSKPTANSFLSQSNSQIYAKEVQETAGPYGKTDSATCKNKPDMDFAYKEYGILTGGEKKIDSLEIYNPVEGVTDINNKTLSINVAALEALIASEYTKHSSSSKAWKNANVDHGGKIAATEHVGIDTSNQCVTLQDGIKAVCTNKEVNAIDVNNAETASELGKTNDGYETDGESDTASTWGTASESDMPERFADQELETASRSGMTDRLADEELETANESKTAQIDSKSQMPDRLVDQDLETDQTTSEWQPLCHMKTDPMPVPKGPHNENDESASFCKIETTDTELTIREGYSATKREHSKEIVNIDEDKRREKVKSARRVRLSSDREAIYVI
jgi:hypothetical protein